ncbi:MAG: SPOR domain-containing protein [Marinicellaceae bacterium]
MIFIRLIFIVALLSNIGLYIYSKQNLPKQEQFKASDPGIKKLVLLNELDAENTFWEETSNQEETTDEVFNQECYSVGVFNSRSEIRPVLDILKSDVIKIRTRKVISTQEAGYWVYIPAMKSREEALAVGRQLSQIDIMDYYVVTGGENENTISLGLYRDRQNADDRLAELLSKGFRAEKQVKVEQWPEFWLDFAIASDQFKNIVDITTLNPDVSTNKVECNW